MKTLRLFLLPFAFCLGLQAQQPRTVQASTATATVNQITADLSFGTGRVGSFLSGSSLTLAGTFGGTPTGGTLNLSNLTLTLPATVSGGTSSFQPLDSDLTSIAALSTTANGRSLLTASALTAAGLGLTNGSTIDAWGAVTNSSGLAGRLSDETGTGLAVFATSPSLTTPSLGVATATSINGNTFTTGTYTLTGTAGKTLTFSNTLTLAGTDSSTLNIGGGGTLGSAAFTAAGAYEVPLTFSTGLTRSTNTITVNTSQNIATLSNLTSNGFVKTSGGAGTLSVDTTTYQTQDAGLTALAGGSDFVALSGPATSTKTFTLPNASATILTDNAAVTVAQGGTGIASGTSGGVPYFSGSTTIASSAALAANAIMIGGGAGVAPSTTTTGAGVVTALASAVTGSGGISLTTDPVLLTPNAAVSGNVLDVTKRHNTQTLSADVTWTLSATPSAGTVFGVDIVDNGTARTVTLPAGTWKSLTRGGTTITTITTSPNVSYEISIRYDGTNYWMIGDPFNISMLTADASPTSDDIVETYDISTSLPKKATLALAVQSVLPSPGAIGGTTPAAGTFTTLIAGSTGSVTLGTAGSAVGQALFKNATSGTATLAPPTGALGTYTVTLPNAASTLPIFGQQITFAGPTAARTVTLPDAAFTVARTDAANTFTGASTATSWTLVTPAITTSATLTRNSLGTTSTDGYAAENTTAATSGNQQISPRIRMRGFGWDPFVAVSRSVDMWTEVLPVQNNTPYGLYYIRQSVNGGATSDIWSVQQHSGGTVTSRSYGTTVLASGGGNSKNLSLVNTNSSGADVTALTVSGDAGSTTLFGPLVVSVDTLSGAGAVSVTKDTTKLTSTGSAQAITLADGVDGQIKRIIHDVDGGSMVLTPTTKTGWSTATFTNAGDSLTAEFVTTRGWIVLGSYGTVVAP